MKTIYCTLPVLFVLSFGGCETVERTPGRTEEAAIISCEAGHVTIRTAPNERLDGEINRITEESGGNESSKELYDIAISLCKSAFPLDQGGSSGAR